MATAVGRRARAAMLATALLAAAVVALATGRGAGADAPVVDPAPRVVAGASRPVLPGPGQTTLVPAGPPDLARLLQIADEVSADGRYVRIGDVEISASPVVTRPG